MKRKKLTVYHEDGSEENILSAKYDGVSVLAFEVGGITGIGYSIFDENKAQIIVQPTLYRKIKIEEIDA